jgi:hypothetical protein
MVAKEKPSLQPLHRRRWGELTVHLDGCVEGEMVYDGALPGWIGRQLHVCSGMRRSCGFSIRAPLNFFT